MSVSTQRNAAALSWRLWTMLAVSLGLAGCARSDAEMAKLRKAEPEGKKVGTGRSFEAETRVDRVPMPSAAIGWTSEAVVSGQDDWEPAVAVDPAHPGFVYQ